MTFSDIVRGASLQSLRVIKSPDGKEHWFVELNTGSVIYVRPKDRIVRKIGAYITTNAAYVIAYSHTTNNVYFFTEFGLIEFNLDSFKEKGYDYARFVNNYVNLGSATVKQVVTPHYVLPSTDGNIHFAPFRYLGVPNVVKFNVTTKEFSTLNYLPDPEIELIHGAFRYAYIDQGDASLHGYYTEWLYSDAEEDLFPTIKTELEASGLTYTMGDRFQMLLHWEDRDLVSATRRVFLPATTWRFVDLKDTSVHVKNPNGTGGGTDWFDVVPGSGWTDETSSSVSSTNFEQGNIYDEPYFGITKSTFDLSIIYSRIRFVGRFAYQFDARAANAQYFDFAYSPTTGKPIYPNSFNKSNTFLVTSRVRQVYWANMPMAQGFSGSNEYVFFHQNTSGQWGYYRPDTEAFTLYDPTVNPSGYSLVPVDLNDPGDPNGLGCYVTEFKETTEVEVNGESFVKPALFSTLLNINYRLSVDPVYPIADLEIEYAPDQNSGIVHSGTVRGIATSVGNISSALETADGEFAFGGATYTGIVIGKDVASSFVQTEYFGDSISLYTSVLWGTKAVFAGYLGFIEVVECADIDNPVLTNVAWGFNQYTLSLAARTNEVISCGIGVRRPNYENNYMKFGFVNTGLTQEAFPNLPKILDVNETITLRAATGLGQGEYTTDAAHALLKNYSASSGLTWTQIKNLFLTTTPYRTYDVVSYGNIVVIQLHHNGISALRGVDIYEDVSGVGDVITSEEGRSTHYPKLLWLEKADLSDLVEADYKLVEITAIGFGNNFGIAMYATDNYVCGLFNEGTNLVARCILKTALASAAASGTPIATVDKTITIPNGTSGGSWGNLQVTGTNPNRRIAFGVGDNLYASFTANIPSGPNYVVAAKINIAAQTYEPFLVSSSTGAPTMTYNPATDNAMVCRGSGGELFTDISLATLPLTY